MVVYTYTLLMKAERWASTMISPSLTPLAVTYHLEPLASVDFPWSTTMMSLCVAEGSRLGQIKVSFKTFYDLERMYLLSSGRGMFYIMLRQEELEPRRWCRVDD